MNIAILSIIVLIGVIAVGFTKKSNVGIIAFCAAALLGRVMGVAEKEIIAGFGSNLFVTLLGICFLCTIAQTNGSLELLAKKSIQKIGNKTWLAPIMIWLIGIIISGVGPGSLPTLGVMCAIAMPVAHATGYDPIMMGIIGEVGIHCGRFSPFTSDNAVIGALAAEQGIDNYKLPLFIYALLTSVIIALFMFITFGGLKVKAVETASVEEDTSFSKEQLLTLAGFAVVIALTIILRWNIGLSSFCVVTVLIILGVIDEKATFKAVPWGVLIMVTGVGVLMSLVIKAGGIDLVTNALGSVMSSRTAAPLMSISAGVMSWFSSATGVVFPTMIPTVTGLVERIGGGLSPNTLIAAIAIAAAYTGLSPASTGGGLILATRATDPDFTKEEETKAFVKLFIASCESLAIIAVMGLIGLYSFMG